MEIVRDLIYRPDVSVDEALARVRAAKEAIDEQRERDEKGFNVKLGRGGIREIEFIAQALEIAHGGRDPWLRSAHTLITLGRLADRSLISKEEHSQLSDAYENRPPYQQNDYIGWITDAKRQETREARLAQMLDELRRRDVYMKMPYKAKRG